MPFVRAKRIPTSTDDLNQTEADWWNQHAAMIERIWGLSDVICREARRGYHAELRALFQKYAGSEKLHILEIACGSGWPGRLLADARTRVTGIDFSEEQIRLAREKAVQAGNPYCDYVCDEVRNLPAIVASGDYNGAFIHCGIHHLSTDELRETALSLAKVPRGFPLLLVEPMYHDRGTAIGWLAMRPLDVAYRWFQKRVTKKLKTDKQLLSEVKALFQKANENQWFLSPKEMPFTRGEIDAAFGELFDVVRVQPVTYFGLRFAQHLATLEDAQRADQIGAKWLPALNRIDRALIRSDSLVRMTDEYLFTLIALRRK